MTHFLEVGYNEFNAIKNGNLRFTFLKTFKPIVLGDTIIFAQLMDTEDPEEEHEEADGPYSGGEHSVVIDYIYSNTDGLVKKGHTLITFKEKES